MSGAKTKKNANPNVQMLVKIAISALLSGCILILCFFAFSALALRQDSDETMLSVFAYLSCGISAFAGGLLCGRLCKKSGLLYGALSSVPVCILLLILTQCVSGHIGSGFGIGCVLLLFFGSIGGVLAVNKKPNRRYK